MSLYTFRPVVDEGIMTAVQLTTAAASATQKIGALRMKIKCLTQPSYIRLVKISTDAVTTANGYYMAVGDELDLIASGAAQFLAYIRAGDTNGALSVMWGEGE